jgi:hypothetical protein
MKVTLPEVLAYVLGGMSAILLMAVFFQSSEVRRTRADLRLARDVVKRTFAERDRVLRKDVADAVEFLKTVALTEEWPGDFQPELVHIMSAVKIEVARDTMAFLRENTGKDFGDKPSAWIEGLSVYPPQSNHDR